MSPSLFSNSLFVFPLLIPIWSFHSSLLIDADCVLLFRPVFQCRSLGNSWGGWGFKALKDGLITCRHSVRGFNRLCQPCLGVQRGAGVPAWYPLLCSYWRFINFENKERKAEARGFDLAKGCQLLYILYHTKLLVWPRLSLWKGANRQMSHRFSLWSIDSRGQHLQPSKWSIILVEAFFIQVDSQWGFITSLKQTENV